MRSRARADLRTNLALALQKAGRDAEAMHTKPFLPFSAVS